MKGLIKIVLYIISIFFFLVSAFLGAAFLDDAVINVPYDGTRNVIFFLIALLSALLGVSILFFIKKCKKLKRAGESTQVEKKSIAKKLVLRFSVFCVVFGLLLTAGGLLVGGKTGININGRISYFTSEKYVDFICKDNTPFSEIHTQNITYANISVVPSDVYGYEIITTSPNHYSGTVTDNVLSINCDSLNSNVKTGFDLKRFRFITSTPKIIIYVPATHKLNKAVLDISSGNISMKEVNIEQLSTTIDTGNITIKNCVVNQSSLSVKDVGNITISSSKIGQTGSNVGFIGTSAGDVKILNSSLNNVVVHSNIGNITANQIKSSEIDAEIKTGYIQMNGTFSGKTMLLAETGNIGLLVEGKSSDYGISALTTVGNTKINGKYSTQQNSAIIGNTIEASANVGNVDIRFTKK